MEFGDCFELFCVFFGGGLFCLVGYVFLIEKKTEQNELKRIRSQTNK